MFKKKLNNRKGFTLIELIVVIAILAILAVIAIPRLGGFQDSAKKKADIATAKTMATATATLIADQRITLPASGTLTETLISGTTVAVTPTTSVTVDNSDGYIASFLQSIPKTRADTTTWTIRISSIGDVEVFAGTLSATPTAAELANEVFPTLGTNYN